MALPAISAFRVEMLRFTFFYGEHLDARDKNWWSSVAGGLQPETQMNKPSQGEYLESGNYLDGQFDLKVAFNRIDWVLQYPLAGLPEGPSFGTVEEIANTLLKAIGEWVSMSGLKPVRVAFGAVVVHPAADPVAGNRLLTEYVPFLNANIDAVRDLFLQLNYPKPSDVVDGLMINEVVKLGVLTGQYMELSGGIVPKPVTNYMFRAELDLSSSFERVEQFDSAQTNALLESMLRVTVNTLTEGVRQ